jgi:hypothetical protein
MKESKAMGKIVLFPDRRRRCHLEHLMGTLTRERAEIRQCVDREGHTCENMQWLEDWRLRAYACAEELVRLEKEPRHG